MNKKQLIRLLLLSLFTSSLFIGCDFERRTFFEISFEACDLAFATATGSIRAIDDSWDASFPLHPLETVKIEVPHAGTYEIYVWYYDLDGTFHPGWNHTYWIDWGQTMTVKYSCKS